MSAVPDTGEVWTRMKDDLLAWFRRRVADPGDREDLLQETFVRVHDGLPGLVEESKLGPWVARIARNVLTDHLRSARPGECADPDALASRGEAADNLNAEVEGWLRSMAAQLPPGYREAVELAELQGLPQAEVGRRLGLSLSGAKSRVQRGRRRLRELLLDCCHLEFDRRGNVVDCERRRECGCDREG